jgi:phage pi2 protein 07
MNLEILLDKMLTKKFSPASTQQIAEFELKENIHIPNFYKEILKVSNGGYLGYPTSGQEQYYLELPDSFFNVYLDYFYSIDQIKDDYGNLKIFEEVDYKHLGFKMLDKYFPIMGVENDWWSGILVCSIQEHNYGQIFYFDLGASIDAAKPEGAECVVVFQGKDFEDFITNYIKKGIF